MKTKTLLNSACAWSVVLFLVTVVSAQKNFNVGGRWYISDAENSLELKIKKLKDYKIAFSFKIKNGEETGKLDGVGYFYKGAGSFSNPEIPDAGRLSKPCRVEFNQSGNNLIINHTSECKRYIKKDLVFAGVYSKTDRTPKKTNIFEKKSLPTAGLEEQLKNWTGNDYELFQTAMKEAQMPSENGKLLAKRYNDCLRMNCEWDRAFIVHYGKELQNGAVFFRNDDGRQFVYYYSKPSGLKVGITADILNWTNDLRRKYGEITLVHRNESIYK